MGVWSTAGRVLAGTAAGALGALVAAKIRDDRYVDEIWRTLEESGDGGERFTKEMVADLPGPARRYFLHAIRPGTRLASRVHFGYHGGIKPAMGMPWMSLAADQIAVKNRGFVWKARAESGPLVLTGADHYLDGEGRMRISLFGLVPVVNATGPDLSKSALGRLLLESGLMPAAILPAPNVQIEGIDESRFRAVVTLHGETVPMTLTVDQDGRLGELVLLRWGNLTDDGSYHHIPFGLTVDEEQTFDGYTLPSKLRGGWWYGTERYDESLRITMDRVEFM